MNIFVTGAAGFIGHTFCRKLSEQGHTVFGLVHDKLLASPCANTFLIRGDVTSLRRMQEIVVNQEIDRVYHFASNSIVQNCRRDPLGCFNTNVIGTATILEAVRLSDRECRVMCMESDKAYGPGPVPYVEEQSLRPQAVYESSKACVSHLVSAYYLNYGTQAFGVRAANVYGPGDANLTRIIPGSIVKILQGGNPYINEGAEKFTRQYIFIDDLFEAISGLMEHGDVGCSINVGPTQDAVTVESVIHGICDMMGVEREYHVYKRPPQFIEIVDQSLNISRLLDILPGFTSRSLDAGLLATIPWYRKRYETT